MADELVDIYDENNKPLNVQKMKSEAHAKGLWHRIVHIWIYNSKKEIILQLRAKNKEIYPDRWDISCGGHIGAGEEVTDAALRELEEELGLKIKKEELHYLKVYKSAMSFEKLKNNEFCNIFLLKFDGDIKKLKIQKEEIQEIKFFSLTDLENDLNSKSRCEMYVASGDYGWREMIKIIKNVKIFTK